MRLTTIIILAILLVVAPAFAQEHHHPPEHEALHETFYKTWMQPDQPHLSCCNKQDCYPTEAKFENGKWWARQRETGGWMPVPPEKVEQNRDNPDGRNHVCASPAGYLFCFSLGNGT